MLTILFSTLGGLIALCAACCDGPRSFSAELDAMRSQGLITTDQLSGRSVWHRFP